MNGSREVDIQITRHVPRLAISVIAFAELLYGIRKSSKPVHNMAKIQEGLRCVSLLQFDGAAAEHYSRIRLESERKGHTVGDMDLLIAATALAHKAILVTHNTKDFEDIEGLQLEDWLA
jgi:tRNA(fMet)-specific endonuclease VapC